MKNPPSIPSAVGWAFLSKRPLLFSKFAGYFAIVVGITVLIGWYEHSIPIIQIVPSFPLMQFNTALGFALCGTGFLFLMTRRLVISKRLAGLMGGTMWVEVS